MSYSELWEINRNWSGKVYKEYKNSWLFCPIVWDILLLKYIPEEERKSVYGMVSNSYMSWLLFATKDNLAENEKSIKLNKKICNSGCEYDKVVWDLSNLAVFNTADKEFIADCIIEFINNHDEYFDNCDDEITKRFIEIANDIRKLPRRCKYFVFHGTSCDDNVEYWFYRKRLCSWKENICEFAIIKNNKIVDYKNNLEFISEKQNFQM